LTTPKELKKYEFITKKQKPDLKKKNKKTEIRDRNKKNRRQEMSSG
jgi:hypothetical protein